MIINGYDEYKSLLERIDREECILTPIFRDVHYHPVENQLLCVGITFLDYSTYVISVSHSDARMFDIPSKPNIMSHEDIRVLAYVTNTQFPELSFTPYVLETHNTFGLSKDINRIIPITVWSSIIKKYNNKLIDILLNNKKELTSNKYIFTKKLLSVLRRIESAGIYVDKDKLTARFGETVNKYFPTKYVYSQYNPYTITGRPSNNFGGINFSALNKHDGTRDAFISRYENGSLVQIDFEAYHLRLIANELGIPLPSTSIHRELAKLYFGTEHITDEMYAQSKQKTFEIMYGMSQDTYNVELFQRIHELRHKYQGQSSILLPSGNTVDVIDPSPSKLYNYFVQSLETVRTLPKLEKILDLIFDTRCHLTLYTYDSILLDVEQFDTLLIKDIVDVLEEDKKFPVRVYAGTTYGNIKEISL
jgi:hypothetical protein